MNGEFFVMLLQIDGPRFGAALLRKIVVERGMEDTDVRFGQVKNIF
jgi:hypothetical protein